MAKKIPMEFLSILEREGISLKSEGVADTGLKPKAALKAIELLRSSNVGITGGEIWEIRGRRFAPTYDIWDVEKTDYSDINEFVRVSLEIAERQVRRYLNSDSAVVTLGI